MLKRLSEAFSQVAYFATFLIVSITLGGLIYFDSFSKSIEYDISIFDLDFYNLFIKVIVLDQSNFIGYGLILFTILFIVVEFFPKTITFFLGIFHFCILILIKTLKEPLNFLLYTFFMVLMCPLIIIDWFIYGRIKITLIKIIELIARQIKAFDSFSKKEQEIIKNKYKMEESYKDYEKSSIWVLVSLGFLIIWLKWLIQFGHVADKQVENYKTKEMSHLVYIQNNNQIQKIPSIYISKTKNGYLVMIENNNTRKAVIYSDNVVNKIEKK